MTEQIAPDAPESLPKYLHEGMEKQDVETLHDVIEHAEELIEYQERPVPETEIPDDAERVEDADNGEEGTIYIRHTICNDDSCHCADPGDPGHGPYKYLVHRNEKGEVRHEYKGKP